VTKRQAVMILADELNVEIICARGDWGRLEEIELLAPRGQHFAANGCHSYVLSRMGLTSADAPLNALWQGAYEALSYGLEACCAATPCEDWQDGGCDVLREAETEVLAGE